MAEIVKRRSDDRKSVLVIGASRGIGRELVTQYLANGEAVWATGRLKAHVAELAQLGAQALHLDVLSDGDVLTFAEQMAGTKMDVVIVNAGVFGPRHLGLDAPSELEFNVVMQTNVLGVMRVFARLEPMLAVGAKVAVISSRMGSIGSRASYASWLYRASKAALNSALKDASLALQGRAICVALHPGWVRTDMGGAGADLEPAESVRDIRLVVAKLRPEDNGSFFNHDGVAIAW